MPNELDRLFQDLKGLGFTAGRSLFSVSVKSRNITLIYNRLNTGPRSGGWMYRATCADFYSVEVTLTDDQDIVDALDGCLIEDGIIMT